MTLSKSPRAARSRARGFSLIELIVAIAVFAIGIMAVIPMLAFNIKSNTYSKSMGMANYVAERHLEKIRSWPVYETTVVDGVTRIGINNANRIFRRSIKISIGKGITWKIYCLFWKRK